MGLRNYQWLFAGRNGCSQTIGELICLSFLRLVCARKLPMPSRDWMCQYQRYRLFNFSLSCSERLVIWGCTATSKCRSARVIWLPTRKVFGCKNDCSSSKVFSLLLSRGYLVQSVHTYSLRSAVSPSNTGDHTVSPINYSATLQYVFIASPSLVIRHGGSISMVFLSTAF